MTRHTYVNDLPNQSVAYNKRDGIRLKRQLLLPNSLRSNPHFQALLDSTDEVLDDFESGVYGLQNLRNPWVTNTQLEEKVKSNQMLGEWDWLVFEDKITQRQTTGVGFFSPISSPRCFRNAAKFWCDTSSGVDFLNFCFGLGLAQVRLWTTDYVNFTEEHIGYPTTHIRVRCPKGLDKDMVMALVYQVVPYTTVIYEIEEY